MRKECSLLLPTDELSQADAARIAAQVPGGIANVQEIYALSPLQEHILSRCLAEPDSDSYVLISHVVFPNRELLDRYLAAMQEVIARHDILRTTFMWDGLKSATQVVLRNASVDVTEIELEANGVSAIEQLAKRFDPRQQRMDLTQAPLLRFAIAKEPARQRWVLTEQMHQLLGDRSTREIMHSEVDAVLQGRRLELPTPQAFREYVEQARFGVTADERDQFFRRMLGDIDEPTMPFGLTEVRRDDSGVEVARVMLPSSLTTQLRAQARRLDVTMPSLCHVAWGQVIARTSGREQIVYGTVVGRLQRDSAQRVLGVHANTLPVRLNLDDTGVEATVRQAHALLAGLHRHKDASLAAAMRCSSVAPPARLFTALLDCRDLRNWRPASVDRLLIEERNTSCPIQLFVDEFDETTYITARADRPASPQRMCSMMQRTLEQLVEALEQRPESPVRTLDVLPADERRLVLESWNATTVNNPSMCVHTCVHTLFEEQVARAPNAVAVVQDDVTLTYAELNAQANRLAHRLIASGVGPDKLVGLCVERTPDLVVGMLATLKAGGAFVPLDPHYPRERLQYLVRDAAPVMLVCDDAGRAAVGDDVGASVPVFSINDHVGPTHDENPLIAGLRSTHLTYVIYTSGSTGAPKGVMVEHRALVNLCTHIAGTFALRSGERMLQFASTSFDVSIEEIFPTLISGATLVLRTEAMLDSLEYCMRRCDELGIRVLELPTSYWHELVESLAAGSVSLPPSIRLVVIGNERARADRLQQWHNHVRSDVRLLNGYGPTETTVTATIADVSTRSPYVNEPPIGRPISNTQVYLLDAHRQPVPQGAVGEMYIGGAGVARGYLKRPELTAERFVSDPFSTVVGARLYKTGDLARYLPDGNLEFVGRNDDQVKIRGHRIELGEIEARLVAHASVRDAVVAMLEDRAGNKRLVAYVTTDGLEGAALVRTLREHLATQIPAYMVPSAYVRLGALPLTPSGKLDRKALPPPDADAVAQRAYEPPQGEVEERIAALWCELLGLVRVGRHDHFFELGGHSLLAVRLIEQLRRLGLGADVRSLFAAPTLSGFAATLGSNRDVIVPPNVIAPDAITITPDQLPLIALEQADIDKIVAQVPGGIANVQDIYALSPLQEGILFHYMLASDGDPYLIVGHVVFPDPLLLDRYLDAVQQVVNRHDILRSAFMWDGLKSAAQVVLRRASLHVTEVELEASGVSATEQLKRRLDPRHHRMDLSQAPLLRLVIAKEPGSERWILTEVLHHLIGDHSTQEIMHAEVDAILRDRKHELPTPPPFRDLVAQARLGIGADEHEKFFRKMLGDVDEPTTPFGLTEVYRDGIGVDEARVMLPVALTTRLRAQARRLGVTMASLCHVAWGQIVARASGREQVVFGTLLLGRMHGSSGDHAMGLYINTLPIRLDLDETSVEASVRKTHSILADLLRHEHASLALAQRCSGVAAPAPLFSALLNYHHSVALGPSATLEGPLKGVQWLDAEERTNYPIVMSVEDFGDALRLIGQGVQPISPERLCAMMEHTLEQLAHALEQRPATAVRALDVLPEAERTLLLETWNATDARYPSEACIHQLFEQQVRRTPDAIALVQGDVALTYADLNARANRLAHRLIALGVGPDRLVGLCTERRPHLVVGILAILKAGGAYVPLDPSYPSERLRELVEDAQPVLLLADALGRSVLGVQDNEALVSLDEPAVWADESASNPVVPGLTSMHLAYIIYTSGSTGRPKGVMVEHAQVTRLFEATDAWYRFSERDVWCLFHSFAFDFTVWELWGALRYGGRLVVVPREIARSPQAFYELVCDAGVTVLNQTPSAFRGFIEARRQSAKHHQLRYVIFGGEALEPSLLRPWYEHELNASSQLVNMYGITETTVHVTYRPLSAKDVESSGSPIGRPIPDLSCYLLDRHGQPVPLGAVGEIYVGGAGLARGYLNRPELTAERFVTDPFAGGPGARMYKTGDLARYLPDGSLDFLGRNDQQVKIRGHRIELGEIEARLAAHPIVRDAVVIARTDAGDKRLVAYVTTRASASDDLAWTLREHLAPQLPGYMVPSAFVRLDALPLTPNGKLDRKVLPAPDADAIAQRSYDPPRGDVEQKLASVWSELFGIERVGRQDHFFDLGGHSLLAVRLVTRIKHAFGIDLALSALFAEPTLAAVAAAVSSAVASAKTSDLSPISRLSRDSRLALSYSQERLWLLSQLGDYTAAYNIPSGVRIRGSLNVAAWRRSLDALVARHEALRSVFVSEQGEPRVELLPATCGFVLREHDLSDAAEMEKELRALCEEEAHAPFDLEHGPVIRGRLITLGAEEHVFLLTQHHIVSDGWSLDVAMRELGQLYRAFVAGERDPLPGLDVQYPDYAAWQRQWLSGERLQKQSEYWRQALAGAPASLRLPTDRPRPPQQSFAAEALKVHLDTELVQGLRRLSQLHGTTLFMTLLSAWAAVLSRFSNQEDLVIGIPTANRGRREIEGLIGFFVNTLALRIDLSGQPSVAELLARVCRTVLSAQDHQDLPFQQVVEIVQPPRRRDQTPLFQVMFAWQNVGVAAVQLPGLAVEPLEIAFNRIRFDIELNLSEVDGCVVGELLYARALFDAATMQHHLHCLVAMLQSMVADAGKPVTQVDLSLSTEQTRLVEQASAGDTPSRTIDAAHEMHTASSPKRRDDLQQPDETLIVAAAHEWERERQELARKSLQAQREYWRETLVNAPVLSELPADRRRPADRTHAPARVDVALSEELTRGLRSLCQRHGMTLEMTLLSCWSMLMSRLSGQQDIIVGAAISERVRAEAASPIVAVGNTLPLRFDFSEFSSVSDLLRDARSRILDAERCQEIPFDQILEVSNPPRSQGHSPLFQILVRWLGQTTSEMEAPNPELTRQARHPEYGAPFDLTLTLGESNACIAGSLEFATSLFERTTIERYWGYFRNLLGAIVVDDAVDLDTVQLLDPAERHRLLIEWNDTIDFSATERCIHEAFEECAAETPESVALLFNGCSISYGELNQRANRLARYLRTLGIGPHCRVAICLERSPEMVVALLAILKAGGAYVPLDPTYPTERLAFMLADSAPQAVVSHSATRSALYAALAGLHATLPVIDVNADAAAWKNEAADNLQTAQVGLTSRDPAYVIYTSGSTGKPKGIRVSHSSVMNVIGWVNETYQVRQRDCLLFVTSISFDLSVYDVFGILAAGATIWLADRALLADPQKLTDALLDEKVTFWDSAPAALQLLVPFLQQRGTQNHSLRLIFNSGDWIPVSLPTVMKTHFPRARFISLGGATEATVWSNYYEVHEVDPQWRSIPYGRPIRNAQYYILDHRRQPVPIGVTGELYIGGTCLAEGYTDAQLTRERFIDSAIPEVRGPLYRTGDLARFWPSGEIEFIGRNDLQVKIRGFRIELGEIEAQLATYPGIREAVVHASEDASGGKRLVAYYVVDGDLELPVEELRGHLSTKLPDYMVPSVFMRLPAMPVTRNGKLDRNALPPPSDNRNVRVAYEAPEGEIECLVASVWQELLRVDRIGRQDSFFELGGHSLLAVRMLSRVHRDLDISVPLSVVFDSPTVAKFTESLLARLAEQIDSTHFELLLAHAEKERA